MFYILHGESVLPNPCLYLILLKIDQNLAVFNFLGALNRPSPKLNVSKCQKSCASNYMMHLKAWHGCTKFK